MWRLKCNILGGLKQNPVKWLSTAADDVIFQQMNNTLKIGVVTLNRPKALNALNLSMLSQIYSQLKKWQSEVAFVIIKGSGEKAFCAGADVRAMANGIRNNDTTMLVEDFARFQYSILHMVGTYKIPYIAFINGITMGGGAGHSILGKYRVATENTVFAMPETAIGLFPDSGASYFLSRLPDHFGMYCGLTGHRIVGSDLLKCGLATHYCDFEEMANLERDLLNISTVNQIPQVLSKYTQASVKGKEKMCTLEDKQVRYYFAADSVENIIERLRRKETAWSKQQLETLMKMSPTSLKLTVQLLKLATNFSLRECLRMDYRIMTRMVYEKDFLEGVRAYVIDKDYKPIWNPSTLEAVSDEKIQYFLAPLPPDKELQI